MAVSSSAESYEARLPGLRQLWLGLVDHSAIAPVSLQLLRVPTGTTSGHKEERLWRQSHAFNFF